MSWPVTALHTPEPADPLGSMRDKVAGNPELALMLRTSITCSKEAENQMELALRSTHDSPRKPPVRKHRSTRLQLLTRDLVDGRSNAAKVFDRLVSSIETDLGGRDQLTAIEVALVEAFAGAAVTLENLNTRLLLGEEIDLSQHALAVSAMVRVASRLGLQRRARDVITPPSVAAYLEHKQQRAAP
jgi:hypothetical protein